MSAPSPVPLAIARSMLSLGIDASRAFWMARASAEFPVGSPPPSRAATEIARASLVKCWPRRASTTAFLCLIEAHFECPDMAAQSLVRVCGNPRCAAARPQLVQREPVLVGVHALPEPRVLKRAQLAGRGQALERFA